MQVRATKNDQLKINYHVKRIHFYMHNASYIAPHLNIKTMASIGITSACRWDDSITVVAVIVIIIVIAPTISNAQ